MRFLKIFLLPCLAVLFFRSASALGDEQTVAQQFQGFNLEGYTDGGDKAWDMKGDTADILTDTIEITNVDANQYGEYDVNIKARTGTLHKGTGSIELEKDVVITSESGTRLTTDRLDWQKEQDLVRTDDRVVLTDGGITASGVGLRAQPGLKQAKLGKEVTVEVTPESQADNSQPHPVTITCDGPLEIDQKVNMAVFHDNVVAVQLDRTLKADKMDVYFNPDTKKIDRVVCVGNVQILQGGNATYAEKAVYDAQEQTFILTGRPKLILMTEDDSLIKGVNK